MTQVEVSHIGDMKFKGVHSVHTVMQINNVRFSGRKFPAVPCSNKAELVGAHLTLASSEQSQHGKDALQPSSLRCHKVLLHFASGKQYG